MVEALFVADDVAELLLLCDAELEPPDTLPPAIETGTLALTPFWFAFACDPADWDVDAPWCAAWYWPDPPHPTWQLELLVCDWLAPCVVEAEFDADDAAVFVLLCEAELEPTETPLPSITTGTLALTAF